jgi:hypothetical protein
MKQFIVLLFLVFPIACQAGLDLPPMTSQQMTAMEKCVGKLDFAKINEIEKNGMVIAKEIHNLCITGKRSEAASKGEVFANEVWYSPELTRIRNCASKATKVPLPDYESSNTHICDGKYGMTR